MTVVLFHETLTLNSDSAPNFIFFFMENGGEGLGISELSPNTTP